MASNIRFFFGTTGENGKYLHWFDEDYVVRNSSMPSSFPSSILKNPWQYLIGWGAGGSGNPQADQKYQITYFNTYYAKVDYLDGWSFLSFWDQSGYNGLYNFPTIYAYYGTHTFSDLLIDMSGYFSQIYNRIFNFTGNDIQEYQCVFEPTFFSFSNDFVLSNDLLGPTCTSSDGLSYSKYFQFNLNSSANVEFCTFNDLIDFDGADGYFFIHDGYVDSSTASNLTKLYGSSTDGSPNGKSCFHNLSAGNYTLEFTSLNNVYGSYNFIYHLHDSTYDNNIIINDTPFVSNLSLGVPGYYYGNPISNFYYFTVDTTQDLFINVTPTGFSPNFGLFHADGYGHIGTLIETNDGINYISRNLEPGTYGIELSADNIIGSLDYDIYVTDVVDQCTYNPWSTLFAPYSSSLSGYLTNLCNSIYRAGSYAKFYELNVIVPAFTNYNLIIDYVSTNYDCYLYLLRASDDAILAQDDDGGTGTNSRIVYTINNLGSGTPTVFNYKIECTSYSAGNTGLFDLSISLS